MVADFDAYTQTDGFVLDVFSQVVSSSDAQIASGSPVLWPFNRSLYGLGLCHKKSTPLSESFYKIKFNIERITSCAS